MRNKRHQVDLCVVGGGLAGMCLAIAAARHGLLVALMHERPVLGGNASSEIRMCVNGAHGTNNRETGIIEEILLENRYRNPTQNYSIWDSILYEKVRFTPNITLLLNCTCTHLQMDGSRIKTVKGWQMTTQTWHSVSATFFADCSGDSILAPLSGADFCLGREARGEFNEDIEPPEADLKTMGLSCLIQARQTDHSQPFIPPVWANIYTSDEDLPYREHTEFTKTNFWWIELGGEADSIHDTEEIRDDLLKIAFGVWDHIKNHGDHGAENWALDWVGFLPGKRESRRYIGDYILTENDVRAEGRFEDLVAYGGWSMDDHNPAGMNWPGEPTIFHPAPSPFGIPYRCLYSHNITNLFYAGRNISVTHAAMSSSRVMRTCALVGQAAGTAAALAIQYQTTPRGVYQDHLQELKQMLMQDDCYLPWNTRMPSELTRYASLTASEGDPESLRNGIDRPVGTADNGWRGGTGCWVLYQFDVPVQVNSLRFIFDSNLNRPGETMLFHYSFDTDPADVPQTLVRNFYIEAEDEQGNWFVAARVKDNYQRLVNLPVNIVTKALRLVPETTWGASDCHLFAWDVA